VLENLDDEEFDDDGDGDGNHYPDNEIDAEGDILAILFRFHPGGDLIE
jgi:hypothetical protein